MAKKSRRQTLEKFDDSTIDNLPAPERTDPDKYTTAAFYHRTLRGLCVMVTDSGTKTFYLLRRINGRQARTKIGAYPGWTPEAAIARAKELIKKIDRGEDPNAERQERRSTPTLRERWKVYKAEHVDVNLRPNSQVLYCGLWTRYVEPQLGHMRLTEITRRDVKMLHAETKKKAAETMQAKSRKGDGSRTANGAINLVRAILNDAIDGEAYKGPNVAERIKRTKEGRRDRFLTMPEIERLFAALDAEVAATNDPTWHDFFKLALHTGARRGNVLSMRWQDVDLDRRVWNIPAASTKTDRPYFVQLSVGAVAILAQRRLQAPQEAAYVFPATRIGKRGSLHLNDPKTAWRRIRTAAGLEDVTIHDLRHSCASLMAAAGASLPIIGAQLGHASPATTARYAHMLPSVVQTAVDKATSVLDTIAGDR